MDLSKLNQIRREYGQLAILDSDLTPEPMSLFKQWLQEAVDSEHPDATTMVLSTCDAHHHPDSRNVLLKGVDEGFIFYTNYKSAKGQQIAQNPFAALNFYWFKTARQIRIRGQLKKLTLAENQQYFETRPLTSQISSIISPQSEKIKNRAQLEATWTQFKSTHDETLHCPDYWGGYRLIANEIEFYQGRDARLSDRVKYIYLNDRWSIQRLAP